MKTITLVTVGIWLTGVSSAAALVTTLAKPPAPVEAVKTEAPRDPAPEVVLNLDSFKLPRPNVEPPKVRSQLTFSRPKKKQLKCSGPKSMNLGPIDKTVRYCD